MSTEETPVEDCEAFCNEILVVLERYKKKYECLKTFSPENIKSAHQLCQFLTECADKENGVVSSARIEWEGKRYVVLAQQEPDVMNGDTLVVPMMNKLLRMIVQPSTTTPIVATQQPIEPPHTQDDVRLEYEREDDEEKVYDEPEIERSRHEEMISITPPSFPSTSQSSSGDSTPQAPLFFSSPMPMVPPPRVVLNGKKREGERVTVQRKRLKSNITTQKVDGVQQLVHDLKNRLKPMNQRGLLPLINVVSLASEIRAASIITSELITRCRLYDESIGLAEYYNSVIWGGVFVKTYLIGSEPEWDQSIAIKFIRHHGLTPRRFGNLTNAVLCYHLFCQSKNEYYFISQNQAASRGDDENGDAEEEDGIVTVPNLMGYPLDLVRNIQTRKHGMGMVEVMGIVIPTTE
jgi:hypothetical protein